MAEVVGRPRYDGEELTDMHRDLALAAQEKLEEVVLMLARRVLSRSGQRNLCLAGGVALNCKMNGVLWREAGCDALFVQPLASDAGTALGAALWVHRRLASSRPPFAQRHVCFGPGFTDEAIERILRQTKLRYRRSVDIARDVADRLAAGKLVAWFQGRMENGARALGHRSILAHPGLPDMKAKLNVEVKQREMWRPFCPSIPAEAACDWLLDARPAPYMIVAYQAMPDRAHRIPAVVHVDGSVRPQTVTAGTDRLYHSLLSHFEALTGLPLILNTSFNVMGEPIICTPVEAVRCFGSTGLDVLAMGPFLLEK